MGSVQTHAHTCGTRTFRPAEQHSFVILRSVQETQAFRFKHSFVTLRSVQENTGVQIHHAKEAQRKPQ